MEFAQGQIAHRLQPNVALEGIPEAVFEYQVNGKSAIEWILERYQITTHKDSQITNDPNDYCREAGNPRYIIDLVKRIVTTSVETNRIIAALPPLEIFEQAEAMLEVPEH